MVLMMKYESGTMQAAENFRARDVIRALALPELETHALQYLRLEYHDRVVSGDNLEELSAPDKIERARKRMEKSKTSNPFLCAYHNAEFALYSNPHFRRKMTQLYRDQVTPALRATDTVSE